MTSGMTLADIKDGTANTFMLSTRYADCGSPVQSTTYSASPIGTPLVAGGPVPSHGTGAGKGGFFGAGAHDRPADGTSDRATFQLAPRLAECRSDDSVFAQSFSSAEFSVALADATVHSFDPSISPMIFCRYLCPGDGFPFNNDWGDN
jgi:hypothetical protein